MNIKRYSKKGFTLIELMIAIAIIGVLTAIITAAFNTAQSHGRDNQVRADKTRIIFALQRTRESSFGYQYPSSGAPGTWVCLKVLNGPPSNGTCWHNLYNGSNTVAAALAPFFPSGIPQPPGAHSGEARYDSYLYCSSQCVSGYAGAVLVWPQENSITSCNGQIFEPGTIDPSLSYCYELLPS